MSSQHSLTKSGETITDKDTMIRQSVDADYWYALINEKEAAMFAGLSIRSMQGFRYRGGGARFVRISSRCIKYRRIDLRDWIEAKLRTSTSDTGTEAA